jgi:F-type H+-transporting ATPase subunit O
MATSSRLTILARSFSSSSVTSQLVKPPLQVFGIEGRYATALYSAASKQSSLEAVEKDLIKFQTSMKGDTKLMDYLKDPSIKRRVKSEGFKAVGSKMNLNPSTTNLLQLLAENGRLGMINPIINAFKQIMAANRGEVVCEVTTSKPLDPESKGKLEGVLKLFLQKGQTILLTTKVDPSIIGGMIVSIGDKYVDMSIASKVKKYSDIIKSAA